MKKWNYLFIAASAGISLEAIFQFQNILFLQNAQQSIACPYINYEFVH